MASKTIKRNRAFWDRHAEGYAKRPVADQAAYEMKLETTQRYLRADWNVMEFGCGTGTTALIHAPHVRHIHAIDVSDKMVEIGRRKASAEGVTNVTFERATVQDLDIPDGSLDAVLGMSILHLLKDMEGTLAAVRRMLEPGGIFVSSTPCLSGSWKLAPMRLIIPLGHLIGRLPWVKFFGKEHLVERITAAGFAIDHRWDHSNGTTIFLVAKAV